jgi:hypothetical protein
MSFFKLSTGEAVKSTGEVEQGGFELIPDNTTCEAMIVECAWKSYEGKSYINAKWQVTKPSQYANRVVFQKIQLMETDSKKLDNAIKMFAAIDQNATGGKMVASGERPTDGTLFSLLNKPMLIKVTVWEMNDKSGNWISKVSPRSSNAAQVPAAQPAAAPVPSFDAPYDDDIPF